MIALDIFRRLGINLSMDDIDRSHRNPPMHRKGRKYPPVILVKLICHDKKEFIYDRRHLLRQLPGFKRIFINENLTPYRRKLFARVRSTFKNLDLDCWSNDGKIHLLDNVCKPSKLLTITCFDDFYDVVNCYF